jgi:hypothetical protein
MEIAPPGENNSNGLEPATPGDEGSPMPIVGGKRMAPQRGQRAMHPMRRVLSMTTNAQLDERMTKIENNMGEVLSALLNIQEDVQHLRRQQMKAEMKSESTEDEELVEARAARDHIESVVQAAHKRFAQYDEDGSGTIDVAELGTALKALGAIPEDGQNAVENKNIVMAHYDVNGDGALDEAEFCTFVRDMATNGKLDLNDDLKADCERIARVVREDPWSAVLRGDPVLRGMLTSLRGKGGKFSRSSDMVKERSVTTLPKDELPVTPHRSETQPDEELPRGAKAKCLAYCNSLPVLHPDGTFRAIWNVLMALLIAYCGITVPLEVCALPHSMS